MMTILSVAVLYLSLLGCNIVTFDTKKSKECSPMESFATTEKLKPGLSYLMSSGVVEK